MKVVNGEARGRPGRWLLDFYDQDGKRRWETCPTQKAAPPASSGLYMQTSQPWTVVLDQAGNPSTVILSAPPAPRPAHSALFGR
jgi:hypothetical protein